MKITFSQFIREGGWSNTITQSVKLTPSVAKSALVLMPAFELEFNKFLTHNGLPKIKIGKPVGSSAYIDRDLENNPTKEYGDIDIILSLPSIDGIADNKVTAMYTKAIKDFVKQSNLPFLLRDDNNNGNAIIVKAGDDWVQVDLVKTLSHLEDWTTYRMTPQHNLKGALIGYLYSSLAQVLNLSIGSMGVQAKEKNNEFVAFRNLKVDHTHTISTNIMKFGMDILDTFGDRMGVQAKPDSLLASYPGMSKGEIKVDDLVNVIIGLGKSFEINNMFGKGDLKHIPNYDAFIKSVKNVYLEKTTEAADASKFDKAETPEAKERAAHTKHLLLNKSKEIASQLV